VCCGTAFFPCKKAYNSIRIVEYHIRIIIPKPNNSHLIISSTAMADSENVMGGTHKKTLFLT
jgi:hypothetical protein